jgi:hypothetical protein
VIVTSKNRTIPLSIPVGFFFLGEGFLLAFALLFALHPEALAVPRHGLAMAHLFLLGFGVGVLLGAMHQLVPVTTGIGGATPSGSTGAWAWPSWPQASPGTRPWFPGGEVLPC